MKVLFKNSHCPNHPLSKSNNDYKKHDIVSIQGLVIPAIKMNLAQMSQMQFLLKFSNLYTRRTDPHHRGEIQFNK